MTADEQHAAAQTKHPPRHRMEKVNGELAAVLDNEGRSIREEFPAVPDGDHECVCVTPEALREIVHGAANAVAPGCSGLTEELLHAALVDDDVCEFMCYVIRDIRNRKVHPDAARALRRCRLILLGKPDGGVRPIAIGEVLLKWQR
jgi:hypothetical protein